MSASGFAVQGLGFRVQVGLSINFNFCHPYNPLYHPYKVINIQFVQGPKPCPGLLGGSGLLITLIMIVVISPLCPLEVGYE